MTGIATAAPILFELFGLLDVYGWFSRPEADLIEIEVCAKSGFRKGQHCHVTKKTFVPFKALHTRSCPYCKSIHCDRNLRWQVHNECHPVHEIETVQWFVLPPTMEWYYKKRHSDYKSLPPYREDCLDALALSQHSSLDLIYPKPNSQIYIPFELDGKQGRVVLKAAHRDSKVTIYWHLDNEYIGATKDIHQMAIITNPGEHVLTLVDEKGEMAQRKFTILKRE